VYRPEGSGPASNVTVDAKAARNLGIRLWRRTGTQLDQVELVAQVNATPAGGDEYLPPATQSAGGYMLVEVFASEATSAPQRYRLTISNAPLDGTQPPGVLRVLDGERALMPDDSVEIGPTPAGATRSYMLTIRNDGPGPLSLSSPDFSGEHAAEFAASLASGMVSPGAEVALTVRFTPADEGTRTAVMAVLSDDPAAPTFPIQLLGLGQPPPEPAIALQIGDAIVEHQGSVDFGAVDLGGSATLTLTLRNSGTATLSITNMAFAGPSAADFSSSQAGLAIGPGEAATVTLRAAPSIAGERAAELRIFSNAQPSPAILRLRAQGRVPIVDCNGNGVDDGVEIAAGDSEDCNRNGVPDECEADSDSDGVIDACDQYPGQDDRQDSDGDGTPDVLDGCPQDTLKVAPGVCGCGVAETDRDGDGIPDCVDPQPDDPTNSAANGSDNAGRDAPALTSPGGGCAFAGVSMLVATAAFAGLTRRRAADRGE
jgi:hypothetical protein